jgi:hypothetical protein
VLAHAPTRFYGTATLDPTRVGRDAGRIADEMIAHLVGLVGSEVTVTLEIDAMMPTGASPHVVRTVTENSRILRFTSQAVVLPLTCLARELVEAIPRRRPAQGAQTCVASLRAMGAL